MTNGSEPTFTSPVMAVGRALVRPGELLVHRSIESDLGPELRQRGGRLYLPKPGDSRDFRQRPGAPPYGNINQRLRRRETGLQLWVDVPMSDQKRYVDDPRWAGRVHFNHVLRGEDFYHGGPGGSPTSIAPPPYPLTPATADRPADIVVLDNGLPANLDTIHARLLDRVLAVGNTWPLPDPELDPMDEDDNGKLDEQAGHGLFICGLIARMAPDLEVRLARVMHADGVVDEALLIDRLSEIRTSSPAKVVNLSLGGYSADDRPPALATEVDAMVTSGRVVVAAAGNAGDTPHRSRPFWPAAMESVIAVGAYDSRGNAMLLWPKSNGADVYAPGVELFSSYVEWPPPGEGGEPPFDRWAAWAGTSFAAPVVAAAIANWLATTPGATPADVRPQWLAGLPNTPSPGWPTTPGKAVPAAKLYKPSPNPAAWS